VVLRDVAAVPPLRTSVCWCMCLVEGGYGGASPSASLLPRCCGSTLLTHFGQVRMQNWLEQRMLPLPLQLLALGVMCAGSVALVLNSHVDCGELPRRQLLRGGHR
jgi:hypothetical protein